MTYGLSRDDAGRILNDYIANNIYEGDLTAKLDQTGAGTLMKMAIGKGRGARCIGHYEPKKRRLVKFG